MNQSARFVIDRRAFRKNALIYALWLLGLVGAALLFRDTLGSHLANRDFAAFWIAGKLAAAGHAAQAFEVSGNAPLGKEIGRIVDSVFLYPPHALFLAVPISYLPLQVAFWSWQAMSAAIFYFAARPYLPPSFPKLLSILTPAALITVGFGQVGLLFGALWLFAFSGSAVAAAALTFKPHLGLLVAIEAARRRRFLATCLIAVVMLALSIAAFGLESWRAWWNEAVVLQVGDLAPRNYAFWLNKMVTPYIGYGLMGWFLFATAAVVLLYREFNVFSAATASFLLAPYGFHYDMTVVCLGFGVLLFQRWRNLPPWQTFVAALNFLCPLLVGLGTWVAPPILLAGLYVQTLNPFGTIKNPEPIQA
ncbi:MAG TPA: glycosyltransferase family 87 protein [Sphingomicrobium sp.]